ncbi:MAG: DUF1533 domain-containing protein [Bacteroidales bacterium]|nr:DUF1533 domain-containing protein [Bacteroidales bacterium]
MRFAERAFKNLTAGGQLTPDSLRAAFVNRMEQFDVAIIAESARWGDAQVTVPKTKLTWLAAINRLLNQYVPYRTDVVLQQFKDRLGYPLTEAPEFVFNNEMLIGESKISDLGDIISIYNANGSLGDIYYTTDGTDPRAVGGGVGNTAKTGNDTLMLNLNTTIELKARIFNNGEWSALKEMMFIINNPLGKLRITEVHYSPLDQPNVNGSEMEFIELKNTGTETINLTGVSFVNGIDFQFFTESIAPGAFIVLSSNALAFNKVYGFMPDGEYTGSLDNSGEKLTLVSATCDTIISFEYKDGDSWPASADGLGNSLVPVNPNPEGSPAEYAYWRASSNIGGSPGKDDPNPSIVPILFNEILSNSEYPETDRIELYNPSSASVNISYWFMSDDKKNLKKWRIPAGTSIPAKGYKTFSEGHYTGTELSSSATEFGSAFGISSHGETIYLLSANADSALTGYGTLIEVGEELPNVSFGTYITSIKDTHFVAQSALSFGLANAYPKVGPIIFNDIMYHPNDGNYEYVEIKNISNATVNLYADDNAENTWKISGLGFSFPKDCKIKSGESIFIIQQGISPTDFKTRYSLSVDVQVLNMNSALSNGGELLELKKPATQYIKDNMWVYEDILVEAVKYNDKLPWPQNPDGAGYALARAKENEYANDPINWIERKVIAHQLIADTLDNSLGNDIQISFANDVLWRNAVAQVKLNEQILNAADYSILDSAIVIKSALFTHSGNYSVIVLAPKFNPSSVNQVIRGTITAPLLQADETDNFVHEAVTILFDEDILWREKISSVKLNNLVLASENYTISAGRIELVGSLFALTETYTITIQANNYTDAVVVQAIKNYKQSPLLVSDSINNTTNQTITIRFESNNDWVTAIEQIVINNSVIAQTLYTVTDSSIVFNESAFANQGEYTISVKAEFYTDVTVLQTIKCSLVADAGSSQTICVTESVALSGTVSEPSAVLWKTQSNGVFENSAALKTTYTPSATDKQAGKAVLVLQTVATEFCAMVSDTLVFTINQATKIVSQVSLDAITCEQEPEIELSVLAIGTGTITYQWYSQSGAIENALNPKFTVYTNSAFSESYYCVVGSECGADVSSDISVIRINPIINTFLEAKICEGEVYQFGNQKLTSANTYSQTFNSVHGCDSVVTLTLLVKDLPVVSLTKENASCGLNNGSVSALATGGSGDYIYQWTDGSSAANLESLSAGIYSLTLTDGFCSVSAQTVVNEIGAPDITVTSNNLVICKGSTTEITAQGADSYAWNPALGLDATTGAVVNCSARSTTTYQIKGTKDGCSSFTEITIKVNPTYVLTDSVTVAWGQTYTFADEVLSNSGTYSKTLATQQGCDSLVTLVFTILEPETVTEELFHTACVSYTFGENILTQSGIYTDSLKTIQGADSIIILNLTILPKFNIQISDTIAYGAGYVLGNKTITETGIYIENFTSVYGCDSVVTLTLQVLEPESKLIEITLNACNSYYFGGKDIYESGIYRDSLKTMYGADSVVVLTLTILPSYFESLLKTVGYGESFIFGKDTLTESGYYASLFQTVGGCDSIVELTLNVLAPEEKTTYLTQLACEEFTFCRKTLNTNRYL